MLTQNLNSENTIRNVYETQQIEETIIHELKITYDAFTTSFNKLATIPNTEIRYIVEELNYILQSIESILQRTFGITLVDVQKTSEFNIDVNILFATLEYQFHVIITEINLLKPSIHFVKHRLTTIIQIMKYIKCIYSSKSITRPKGRAPKNKTWDGTIGAWVENGFNTNEHELLQFIEKNMA